MATLEYGGTVDPIFFDLRKMTPHFTSLTGTQWLAMMMKYHKFILTG
jgi:hypothetical protein